MTVSDVPAQLPGFRLALITAPFVAVLVGFGGSLAVVLAAIRALGASDAQSVSWITGLCLAMGVSATVLSLWHRMPIVTAWSTPGAALIAATATAGAATVTLPQGVGAFILAALLILATATIAPLGRLIEKIPAGIASAMLAGVLIKFVTPVFDSAATAPWFVLPVLGLFLVVRLFNAALAVIAVLVAGTALAAAMGTLAPIVTKAPFGSLTLVSPVFDVPVLLGLGIPLYLVTMASQNLPGAAVLRAAGYTVPMASALSVTGLISLATAPFGAHTSNLAAITAALCTGPDVHPDPAKRWPAGVVYGLLYLVLAAFAGLFVAIFQAMPPALTKTVAGLALLGPLMGALSAAMGHERTRFAAILTFAVTASSFALGGIGSAFWGLVAGLTVWAGEAGFSRLRGSGQT
jgi:benzoate membrane transport protein